jgi:hypothetical protein
MMTGMTNVIVRESASFGPCELLGALMRETATRYYLQRRGGWPMGYAHKRSTAIHTKPCTNCPDHPKSRFAQEQWQ